MPLSGFDIDQCITASAMPGVGLLEYLPIDELDAAEWENAIIAAGYNQQKAVFASTWYAMPYVSGTGAWTEDQQDNEQGDYFRVNLSARLPADTPAVRGELNRMKQHRFLLRITQDGQALLIGTPDQPLRFSSRFDSGAEGGDSRGHVVTFQGASLQKSPGYVPVF
jgi:hypothetical protein